MGGCGRRRGGDEGQHGHAAGASGASVDNAPGSGTSTAGLPGPSTAAPAASPLASLLSAVVEMDQSAGASAHKGCAAASAAAVLPPVPLEGHEVGS